MPHPLAEKDGVWEGEEDTECVTVVLKEGEPLVVEHCESDLVASGLPWGPALTLLLRVTETVEEAVP